MAQWDKDAPISNAPMTIDDEALERVLYGRRFFPSSQIQVDKTKSSYPEVDVDFVEKGEIVVRVMDKHNFYEAEKMPEDMLNASSIGILSKLWIHISRLTKE